MKNEPHDATVPTLEWSIAHLENYVRGLLDIHEFWQPFPNILRAYQDYADDPYDRLPYYWRQVTVDTGSIIRLGYPEDDDFRNLMHRWLDALNMDKAHWDAIVRRKGRPLTDNVEDWDR